MHHFHMHIMQVIPSMSKSLDSYTIESIGSSPTTYTWDGSYHQHYAETLSRDIDEAVLQNEISE